MRLGGTWVLPNSAGLALLVAIIICLVLFRGWLRIGLTTLMTAALLLTLSRSMIFSCRDRVAAGTGFPHYACA